MNIEEFLHHYNLNAPQMMWFLGAGCSRSAGMPSATDIIWDLKKLYYCANENQNISDNELSNESIKQKIQNYLESNHCPQMGSENEYSFYFKFVLGDNPSAHQKYLQEKLDPEKISINSGHRILSALMAMDKTKLVFTTNFDNVLESAYALILSKELNSFNLNGSYAALNALNNEEFPIYAKMHGDFRYFEMKNLPDDLLKNDLEIEKCFINACSRYGMVVSGYSGRDSNVIAAFDKAIEQNNAFPKGLFWITSLNGFVFPAVTNLIEKAKSRGINAHIIPAETFDTLLIRIWRLISNKPNDLDTKIRRAVYEIPKILKYSGTPSYPLVRTNAFPIIEMPKKCLAIELVTPLNYSDFVEKMKNAKSAAITFKEKNIFAWGSDEEIQKIFKNSEIKKREEIDFEEYVNQFSSNTFINAFLTRALARGLVKGRPLILRKRFQKFYLVVSSKHEKFSEIETPLKTALSMYNPRDKKMYPASHLAGAVPHLEKTYWMEAVELRLDCHDNKFWLIIKPDIWIEPDINRREARDFLTEKKRSRYNTTQNLLLDAWKKILLGNDQEVVIKSFDDGILNNAEFKILTTTAFTHRQKK